MLWRLQSYLVPHILEKQLQLIRFVKKIYSDREFKISCGCSSQEQNCRNDWSTCLGLFIETDLTDVKKYFWLCFCFNGSPISISVSSYIAVGWISIFFANDPCGCDCAVCGPVRSIPWTTLARIIWSRFGPVVKGEMRLSISKGRLRPRQYSINFSRFSNDFYGVHFYMSILRVLGRINYFSHWNK